MNTKALRQKILDLAIHGKLVPQDPNDEPASMLLERIRAEKERLIKEGKIKKPKKAKATCDKPHYPYQLPEGWVWTTLENISNDITDFVASGSFAALRENVKYYSNKEYAILVRTKDFQNHFTKDLVYTDKHGYDFLSNSNLHGGELILPNIGASIGKVFIVPSLDIPMTLAPNSIMVRFFDDKLKEYLYYFFQSSYGQNILASISSSTAQGKFNKTDLRSTFIPIPGYEEILRIVSEMYRWLSWVDHIEQSTLDLQSKVQIAKSKILDLAIHGKLVPQDPNDEPASELLKRINPMAEITCDNPHYQNLPKGWCAINVGNAAEYINGRAFKPEEWEAKGRPIIRIQNLNDLSAPYNRSTAEHEAKYLIKNGDLLFAWAASLGTYIWQGNDAWLNQHIFKVIPYSFIDKEYLFYAFQAMISEFCRNSHGSGMVHITKKQFEEVILLLPPLSEQHRIVKRLKILFDTLDKISKSL